MAILMTGLCEKGVHLIWKQCNEELYPKGLEYLEEAAHAGDPEGWFFLGHCYSWGDGAVGFNEKKAGQCFRRGAAMGSYRAVLGAVRAGQYSEEFRREAAHTLEESFQAVKKAAEEGEAFAAYQMGAAFEWENCFSLIPEEERKRENCVLWYEKAAEGGLVSAMVKLGKFYLNGQYVAKNERRSMEWADRAAACGAPWGLYQMGRYHQSQENWDAAFQYFSAAVLQGDVESCLHLGRMYLKGQGTERDLKKAVEYLEEAAAEEVSESLLELGALFYEDEAVERDDEKAFYWYDRAYASGRREAAFPLGQLYLRHSDIQDKRRAEALFREAADGEDAGPACLALGNILRNGICGDYDMEKAISWYERGAESGNAECMEILGCLYFQGEEGVATDYEKAFGWFNLCREAGTLQSYSKLAYLYLTGQGCKEDEETARELFEKAAETEYDGYALYELGYLHERRNTPEDLEKAAAYYQRSIAMGNESAGRRFSHFKKNIFGKWKISY